MARHRKSKRVGRGSRGSSKFGEQQIDLSDAAFSERFSERRLRGRDLGLWEPTSPEDALIAKELHEDVLRQLGTLMPREESLIKHRFGISTPSEARRPLTLEELSRFFAITRERVRQIEARAYSKLRHASRAKHLKPYVPFRPLTKAERDRMEAKRAEEDRESLRMQKWHQERQEEAWAVARASDERRKQREVRAAERKQTQHAEWEARERARREAPPSREAQPSLDVDREQVERWLCEHTDWMDPNRKFEYTLRSDAFDHFRVVTGSVVEFQRFINYLHSAGVRGKPGSGFPFSIKR